MDEKHHWQEQYRDVPSECAVCRTYRAYDYRADQVVRKSPDIALVPYRSESAVLGKGDHGDHGEGVEQKVNPGGQNQPQLRRHRIAGKKPRMIKLRAEIDRNGNT